MMNKGKDQAQSECLRSTIQRSIACIACIRPTNAGLEGQIGSRVGIASETGDPRAPCITGKDVVPTYLQWLQAIGVAEPTSIRFDTFGTGKIAEHAMVKLIRENFDLRPGGIIAMLDL